MLTLDSGVRVLPGIGEARAKSLDRLGLSTVGDLLAYFPRDYEDRTKTAAIGAAVPEEPVCISALVAEAPRTSYVRKGLELTKVKVVDGSAAMTVTFFNQSYVRDALTLGESYVFYGKMEVTGGKRQMTNPVFEREDRARFTGCIMPVYPLTAGVSNNLLAGLTRRCVEDCAGAVTERLPEEIRLKYALAQVEFSYRNIHFPESWENLELAKRRLIFEEFFYLTCGMALLKKRRERGAGRVFRSAPTGEFLSLLPYTPTGA
ncbi:MAG: ATP-dependent DNA helicase RecG, partial [Pseudoflavonifractor sp.]